MSTLKLQYCTEQYCTYHGKFFLRMGALSATRYTAREAYCKSNGTLQVQIRCTE